MSSSSSREQPDLRLQALDRPLALEGVEAGERRRAGERVAGIGVAVEEGAVLLGRAEEALVDPLRRQGRGQRQVAAGQSLREAEQVRRDALLLAGEHRPGAAEAGRHLVADQQHAEAVAQLARSAQVARGVDQHPGCALDQRLDDHRGDLLLVGGEDPLQVGGVAGLGRVGLEEQRPVGGVEEVDAPDGDRADRVAVVGIAQVDERGAPPVLAAALLLVLEGHLQRDLGRGRAGLRVEDARKPRRRQLDQSCRQLGGSGMGEAEHGRVGDLVQLLAERLVDAGVAMAVDVAPQRGDAVDVTATIAVDQVSALRPLDHQRLFLSPALLLGKWMPEMIMVELNEVRRHPLPTLVLPAAATRPA